MSAGKPDTWISWVDTAEYGLCRRLNRAASIAWLRGSLRIASRLGDGIVWYALLLLLPILYGGQALRPAGIMAATACVGLLIYKWLKTRLVRERPYITHIGIQSAARPLDRYSFPSGHTLHAVCFTWQTVAHFPELGWVLVPLATLIAASRVVLGLHYPTDVAAGAAIGAVLALIGLAAV